MAVAAFKSKTRRHCETLTPDTDTVSFSLSTSKMGHRRTKSFTDSSCMYLSDSSSSSGYRMKSFTRYPSSDTECDGDIFGDLPKVEHGITQLQFEPRYMSPLQRHIDERHGNESASSSVNKIRRSSSFKDLSHISKQSVSSDADGMHRSHSTKSYELAQLREERRCMSQLQREASGYESSYSSCKSKYRRSSSYKDLSQSVKPSIARYGKNTENEQGSEDHTEIQQVEERTIRAVHAQTKKFERDPPLGEINGVGLYEMMRSEIQRAVEDLKEFQELLVGRIQNSQSSEGSLKNVVSPILEKLHKYASEAPHFPADSLLKSHKRDGEQHSELEDDQKSADSLKLVSNSHVDLSRVRPRRTRRGADRQMVSKSLDEEARKYFEECVGILKLENLEAEESFSDRPSSADLQENIVLLSEEHAVEKSHQECSLKQNNVKHFPTKKQGTSVKRWAVNADGVLMPWLDSDSDYDADSMSSKHQNLQRGESPTTAIVSRRNIECHGTKQVFNACSELFTPEADDHVSCSWFSDYQPERGISIGCCSGKSDSKPLRKECSSFVKQAISICSEHMKGWPDHLVENPNILFSDMKLCHRNSFRSRIAQGRLLLCGNKI